MYDLDIFVEDLEKLNKYINLLERLPYVNSVERGNN